MEEQTLYAWFMQSSVAQPPFPLPLELEKLKRPLAIERSSSSDLARCLSMLKESLLPKIDVKVERADPRSMREPVISVIGQRPIYWKTTNLGEREYSTSRFIYQGRKEGTLVMIEGVINPDQEEPLSHSVSLIRGLHPTAIKTIKESPRNPLYGKGSRLI